MWTFLVSSTQDVSNLIISDWTMCFATNCQNKFSSLFLRETIIKNMGRVLACPFGQKIEHITRPYFCFTMMLLTNETGFWEIGRAWNFSFPFDWAQFVNNNKFYFMEYHCLRNKSFFSLQNVLYKQTHLCQTQPFDTR